MMLSACMNPADVFQAKCVYEEFVIDYNLARSNHYQTTHRMQDQQLGRTNTKSGEKGIVRESTHQNYKEATRQVVTYDEK